MADREKNQHETQAQSDRGHPMPRRTSPEKSVTLHHHRLAREASRRPPQATRNNDSRVPEPTTGSPRRGSSGESHVTGQSEPKRWFDRSNHNPATFEASSMDVDPPFFQKETDSSNEEMMDPGAPFRQFQGVQAGARQMVPSRPTLAHSSSADDYRSVIDDLTIENKRLKEELKRYKQFSSDMMKKEKLFEIKVHGLPKRKKRELEATLRDFAASLEGSSETPSTSRKPGRHGKGMHSSGESRSKHASSSSSHSRPVDSAYASMSTGPSSHAPNSLGGPNSMGRPSIGSRTMSSSVRQIESYLVDTPDGLFPKHYTMTEKEKKKLVVRRLEQLFTGKITGRNVHRNQSLPSMEHVSLMHTTTAESQSSTMGPPRQSEATREARFQSEDPSGQTKKRHSRDNMSISNSNGDQTDPSADAANGNGSGSGNGGRSGNSNRSPPVAPLPEQRPTRPLDLDPDRLQIPSENLDYIRHLGLVPQEFLVGKTTNYQNVSPDADGWVYLNLLCNLAQLHMINVTPGFIRAAVTEKSTKFQLSPDGRKIRWRGGTDGTKFSSDSSVDNSSKSQSGDESDDGPNNRNGGRRKKQKTSSSTAAAVPMSGTGIGSKHSQFGPLISASSESFHYKPMFVHQQSSSVETSFDETGSQPSEGPPEESNLGNSKWDYSGSGSSQRKKRRHDGAIIYYSGAPFCTDLSGDPGEISPATYMMTSTGQEVDIQEESDEARPLPTRSLSGSSLPFRPLSDSRRIMDVDIDQVPPELVEDDSSSYDDLEGMEFPWCEEPEKVQFGPLSPPLEACGLGGVLPEDHFVVCVTTRRTIGVKDRTRSMSEDTTAAAEAIAAKLAGMRTSSPMPLPRLATDSSQNKTTLPVNIEYLRVKKKGLPAAPLPPPAIFFPPFSTDSSCDDSSDDVDSELEDAILSGEGDEISSEGMMSQRVNPHQSDNTYPVDEDEVELELDEDIQQRSSDDGMQDIDVMDEGSGGVIMGGSDVRRGMSGRSSRATGTASGKDATEGTGLQVGSSVATAGGPESGYSSSMEEDAY